MAKMVKLPLSVAVDMLLANVLRVDLPVGTWERSQRVVNGDLVIEWYEVPEKKEKTLPLVQSKRG